MKAKMPKATALEPEQRISILIDELRRKDGIIEELRKENKILLKISLKKSEEKIVARREK